MTDDANALRLALDLLWSGDAALWQVVWLSVRVSFSAVLAAALCAIPLALWLSRRHGWGKRIAITLARTATGVPAVLVGLLVYLLLSRSGPLGVLGLLFTPTAMIIAQAVLIFPLILVMSLTVFHAKWRQFGEMFQALNIRPGQQVLPMLREGREGLLTAGLTAFGRAIAEVGTVMIVGGNIEGFTRVMTTAIALETSRGNLALAVALGLILLLIALLVNLAVSLLSSQGSQS